MNFLLIVPQYRPKSLYYDFPLGLAYISAAMKKAGLNVSCLNLNHCLRQDPLEKIHHAIAAGAIDVVCTGGLITHYNNIKNLCHVVKAIKPGIKTIVGGGLVTCEPELIFNNMELDYGVLGEGDLTIGELAHALIEGREPADVQGIIYRNPAGQVVRTAPRPPIADISTLPFPDYQGLELDYYLDNQRPYDSSNLNIFDEPRVMPVISSRSCPFQCCFCYHPLGNKYRSRNLDDFFAEVEFVINRYDINGFLILDELLSHSMDRLEEFCQRIKPFHIRWMSQLRVDSVNEKVLRMLKDSGCFYLSYGIESAHDDILKCMKKHTTVAQIEKALELTYDMGISAQGNLLFSARDETVETAYTSVDWALKHWYHRLQLAPLFPLPTSSDYLYAVEKGLIPDKLEFIKSGCGFVNISKMTDGQMDTLLKLFSSLSFSVLLEPETYEVTPAGYDLKRDSPLYSLTVQCPHCRRQVHYRNICLYEGIFNNRFLHCKYCHGRFDISVDWFEHYRYLTVEPSGRTFLDEVAKVRQETAALSEPYKSRAIMRAPKPASHPYFMFTMTPAAPLSPPRRFAILLPMTNCHKKVAVHLGQALARRGCHAAILEIPGLTLEQLAKTDRGLLESFYEREAITDTFSLNVLGTELAVPSHIRHHQWLQGASASRVASSGDVDPAQYVWFDDVPPASHYNAFRTEPLSDSDYDAEIGVTCNYIEPLPPFSKVNQDIAALYLNPIRRRLLDCQNFAATLAHAEDLLAYAESQVKRRLEGARQRLVEFIAHDFINSILRVETLQRLRYLAKKHQWRLKIIGRYWQHSPLAEYASEFVGDGAPLARFLQRCKVNIHLPGPNNAELLDILACGAFCIARRHPDPAAQSLIERHFPAALLPTYQDDRELEKLLTHYLSEVPAARQSLAAAAADLAAERFSYDALARSLAAVPH